MGEKRVVAADEAELSVMDDGSLPCLPCIGVDRVSGGPYCEQINHHQFAVVRPARIEETGFGVPAHRKSFAAIEHPGPVNTLINLLRLRFDLRVVKVRVRHEHAAEEEGSVDRRKLDAFHALPGLDIREVIEEAVHLGKFVEVPLERVADTVDNSIVGKKSAYIGDTQGGEAEASGGNTSHATRIAFAVEIVAGAIEDLTGCHTGL